MKRLVSGIMLTLLLTSMLTLAFNIQTVKAEGTIYIRADGSVEGTNKIQQEGGLYIFTSSIEISSIVIEKDDIVIDGNGYILNGSVSGIRGFDISYRNNVTVKNTRITKFGDGIYVYHSNSCRILNDVVDDCMYAIDVMHISNNNTVSGNFGNNSYGGISVDYSSNDNTVTNNTVTNSKSYGWGLYLWSSNGNVFSDNTAINNSKGMDIRYAVNNTIHRNSMSGNNYYGAYVSYSSDNIISQNNITANEERGIGFSHSSDNVISGNTIANNTYDGIELYENSLNNSIVGNTVINNLHGIWLHHYSDNNYVAKNTVTNNTFGIRLSESVNHNRISGNDILANSFGIGLWAFADDNLIYHNNFVGNTQHVEYASQNTWDSGYPSGGNYWSNYTGIDANGDGVGDTPHIIDADSQDRYPLVHPWSPLLVHNINTGLGYATIQEAINAPETLNEHTIFVEAGTYYEHVVVSKSISLMGEDESLTVIDGNGAGKVVLITANNVSMSGFAIRYSGYGLYDAGIWITSNSNRISNNHISNNSWGISLEYATLNTIKDNVIDGSWHSEGSWGGGVVLWSGSNDNLILNNVISCREDNGIYLQGNENQIIGNTMMNYFFSAVHFDSSGNIFYHNNFMEKEMYIIWIAGAHIWDNGYPSGGNYWSDYTGVDSDGDGIGDTPYVIDADNQDRYPLMYQWRGHSLCDVNGDGSVDMADISLMIDWFMTSPPNWNPNCDVNNDLSIDMADISLAIDNFMISEL